MSDGVAARGSGRVADAGVSEKAFYWECGDNIHSLASGWRYE